MLKSALISMILVACVACGPDTTLPLPGGSEQALLSCPQSCPSSCPAGQVCLTDGDGCVGCFPAPVSGAPECRQDGDCGGPLPKICRVCDDGRDACAHWTCVSGSCFATTCG